MKTRKKRWIALLCALCLASSTLPVQAAASGSYSDSYDIANGLRYTTAVSYTHLRYLSFAAKAGCCCTAGHPVGCWPLCGSFPGKTDTFPWSKLQKLWPKQASRSPPLPAWENTPISSAMWNGPWSAIRWNAFPFRLQRTMFGVHRSNYRNSTRCPRPSAPLPSGCT